MLSPPPGLDEAALPAALASGWGLRAAAAVYRPVGFGSHHWEVTDSAGHRWFATVDVLADRRAAAAEPLDEVHRRLRAALAAALALREHGHRFVVAPVPTRTGEPLARLGEPFALAVYPLVVGERFGWGEFPTAGHRRAVLDLLVDVHSAPPPVRDLALADDFTIQLRGELTAALRPDGADPAVGPYAERASRLLVDRAAQVRRRLGRYDDLVAAARAEESRAVLTHGEPHPGNTMRGYVSDGGSAAGRGPDGWLLIDWDTALVAPPERDLWALDPGDGSILAGYARATGVPPRPDLLELYRLRWDLTDLAGCAARFRAPHADTANDAATWDILRTLLDPTAGSELWTGSAP